MFKTALLLLTGPFHFVSEALGEYLNIAKKSVEKCLYIKLEPDLNIPFLKVNSFNRSQISSVVPLVYSKSSKIVKEIDVRLLLTSFKKSEAKLHGNINFDLVLTNSEADENDICNYVYENYECNCKNIVKIQCDIRPKHIDTTTSIPQLYKTVCLGGTFDRFHNGHKVLLSEAALGASEKLIVGVSDGAMIQKKILWELIEPVEKRIEDVSNFLSEVDPTLSYEVVTITDPYGPTITTPDIDCLIVTTETKLGGEKVNLERKKKNMHELTIKVIDLIENEEHAEYEDEKLSSSTKRMHLLGALLKPSKHDPDPNNLHCILLQGHSRRNKNCISQKFQNLGVPVLCCDDIMDAILNKNQDVTKDFFKEFHEDLSVKNGISILNKVLNVCLIDENKRNWLNERIYFKLKSSLHQVLDVYIQQGTKLIVIKDSTLFEGGDLGIDFYEIWATILPYTNSTINFKEEYAFDDDKINNLEKSILCNKKYVTNCHRLFCCMWSEEAVEKQVNKAWANLKSIKE